MRLQTTFKFCVSICIQRFQTGCITKVVHPVYFVIYKIWITLFGSSDIAIRLMSALFDTASVVLAYFVGEQLARMINKPKYIIGLSNMLLWAISGAFVYFAHEAQFWALAFGSVSPRKDRTRYNYATVDLGTSAVAFSFALPAGSCPL